MLKIKNLTDRGEIYIYGVIIDDTDASWLVREEDGTIGYQYPTDIKNQLDALKGKPVDVHLASDGGDVAAGLAIFTMLANHDAPVTAYIDSWAASIASVIAFSANNGIIMPDNTFLMLHNPKGGVVFGESDYLRAIADWLDKLRQTIAETYARRVKGSKGEVTEENLTKIKAMMDAETWLTAKEASELFDNVELRPSNEVKAVAQYRSEFKNAPEALKDDRDQKVKNILKVLEEAYAK